LGIEWPNEARFKNASLEPEIGFEYFSVGTDSEMVDAYRV